MGNSKNTYSGPSEPLPQGSFTFFAMGSPWKIQYFSPRQSVFKPLLQKKCLDILSRYDETFSDWSKESHLSSYLNKGLKKPQKVEALFMKALQFAQIFYQKSQGSFDISISSNNTSGLKNLRLDLVNHRFHFTQDAPTSLTFNGFVKGMAIGEISQMLVKMGIDHFLIDGGGGNLAVSNRELLTNKYEDLSWLRLAPHKVYFISNSAPTQPQGNDYQHIKAPQNLAKKLKKSYQIICSSTYTEQSLWPYFSSLADMTSTSMVVNSSIKLDKRCFLKEVSSS